jgi:hypothetical protein
MDPNAIAGGLATHPLTYLCALLIIACVYLFKELRAADRAALDRVVANATEHRATLEKVIPVAEKLATGVDTLERISLTLATGAKNG